MKYLLDTHIFLWLQNDPKRLGPLVKRLEKKDSVLLVSAASAWEIAIKYEVGRLNLPEPPEDYVPSRIKAINAIALPVELRHALAVSTLPPIHRDPFDRILICQAQANNAILVTADEKVNQYSISTLLIPS